MIDKSYFDPGFDDSFRGSFPKKSVLWNQK